MKLYVCWTTNSFGGSHACGKAFTALKEAGHKPEVVKAYGWHLLPDSLNMTPARREVKKLTGKTTVPMLITDDGEAIAESSAIIQWAKDNPSS